jgi:hypothetical protein
VKITADFIKEDELTANMVFQEMSVADRFKAILHIIDHSEVREKAVKAILIRYKPYLMAIREGNNAGFKCNAEGDALMLPWAEQWLYEHYPSERPKKVIEVLPKEKAEEKYNEFYLLL